MMWSQVQKLLQGGAQAANDRTSPAHEGMLDRLSVGQAIRFHKNCPLAPLSGSTAYVLAVRQYRFGTDVLASFQLQVGRFKHFFLTIAEDEQGQYLSLSRALSEAEQDSWFGRDALGFFMEPSTAKTIRCKADMAIHGDWTAERYAKTVDWVEGSISQAVSGRSVREFHYNLLVDESGEKALEIEHDDESGEDRVFVTVYRPVEDIVHIEAVTGRESAEAIEEEEEEAPAPPQPVITKAPPAKEEAPRETLAPKMTKLDLPRIELPPQEEPLFKEPLLSSQPKHRPDFRRQDEFEPAEKIHIPRTAGSSEFSPEEVANLPSFLIPREGNYLALEEVIPPEPERIHVGLEAARKLIEQAQSRNVRVRDVLREMLGIDSVFAEEVIFELPLTEADYRTLAMRYKLRPDKRDEIRARLEEELKRKLSK